MKKINEFINNKDVLFNKLFDDLYYDTSHLSSPHQIKETNSYKIAISHGDEILPFLMHKIIADELYYTVYFLLCQEISGGIPIPEDHKGYIQLISRDFKIWWLENKHKYGR